MSNSMIQGRSLKCATPMPSLTHNLQLDVSLRAFSCRTDVLPLPTEDPAVN